MTYIHGYKHIYIYMHIHSTQVECADDSGWTRESLHKIAKRELSHHNAIIADKIELANAFT